MQKSHDFPAARRVCLKIAAMHEQGGYHAENIEKLEIIAVYEQGTRCLASATLCTSIDMLSG